MSTRGQACWPDLNEGKTLELFGIFAGGGIIFTLIAFVVALSVIVAVHEYGHYIVGRWCGIHAEVFSLGFGPVVYSWHDKRGTKWQLAALPFGGYVKFLGDSDAASGRDEATIQSLAAKDLERTMHGAALWKRSATVAAGPVFNFILSMIVFAGIFLFQGRATEVPIIDEIRPLPAAVQGMQSGDKILAVDGQPVGDYSELYDLLAEMDPASVLSYSIERDGVRMDVEGPFGLPPLVDVLYPQSAAMAADLEVGDVILSVDGVPLTAFSELKAAVAASDGKELTFEVWRNGAVHETSLAPKRTDLPKEGGGFETRWLMGVTGGLFFTPQTEAIGPFTALWAGVRQVGLVISNSISGLYHMITGAISSCNLQGPIGIAEISGQAASQGTVSFIWLIAVLSTAVGLLNLFPIPVLDGGHLVFHTYEAIARRAPSDFALRIMMSAGLTAILSFMVFAVSNDIFCP